MRFLSSLMVPRPGFGAIVSGQKPTIGSRAVDWPTEGHLRIILIALVMAIMPSLSLAQQCGDPPRVDDQSLKGDLEGKAKFLSSLVGDAALKGQIETARTDVFGKYPDANRAHSDTYLLYMFCTSVLSDPKLSAQEKFRAILEFRQAL